MGIANSQDHVDAIFMSLVMPRFSAPGPMPVDQKPPDYTPAHLHALIESTRDMIWSVDLNYRLVIFNKALSDEFKHNHGIKPKAGMGPRDLLTPDRAALWPPLYERALKEGPFQTEYRMADGRCLELELNPIVEDGQKTGVWVICKDIAERKQTQQNLSAAVEALRVSEARYRAAFQTSTDAINIICLSDRRYVDVNPAFCDITGFRREEVIGRTLLEVGIWADPSDEEKVVGLLQRTSEVRNLEIQYRRKNGATIWGLTSVAIIEIDGQPHALAIIRDVTERKRAEIALRESSDLMQLFIEHAPVSIAMFDREMRYLAASRQHQTGLGLAGREIAGRSHYESFPNLPEHFKEAHRRALAGEAVSGEDHFPKELFGVEIWSRWSVHPWYTGAGAVGGILLFGEDITERKRAEKNLAEYQGKLAAALASMMDAVCITDASGEAINYNEAFATFHRFRSKAECPTSLARMRELVEAFTPDGKVLPTEERAVSRALRGETAVMVEYNLRRRDTGETWIGSYSFNPIRGSDGSIAGAVVVARDITERKAAQEALREAEEKFREIFTSAPEGIFRTTPAGKVLTLNPAGAKMLGFASPEEAVSTINDSAHQVWLHPEERSRFAALLEQRGEIRDYPARYKCKDGTQIWVSLTARKICGADGKTLYYQGFIEDLTSRVAAEEARCKAEERFREIFEDAPEGIFQTSPDGRAVTMNPAAAEMLGYESADEGVAAIQDAAHDLWVSPEERARFVALLEQQGMVRDYPHQFKRKDSKLIWVSVTAKKIAGPDGKTICYQGFTEDITEQKLLEAALQANARELQLLSEINNTLVHAKTEKDLLRACCRIMVETGGYSMAWVGFADEGPGKPIVTVAHYGCEESFLESINPTFTWAETEHEDGPVCRSLRTGEVHVEEDICADPLVHSWRTETVKRGYRMAIALPFRLTDGLIASLAVFSETPRIRTGSERKLMEQIASDLAYGIATQRAEIARARHQEDLRAALEQTIHVIAETVDQRDPYTAGHERRVADLCVRIAQKLGLSADRTHGLHLAASIHDLGKIGIPAEILSKPGLLTPPQFNLLKEHAQLGYDILKNVAFPWPIADIVLQHHERLDGSGYPHGLKADAISFEARILAVADVVEAMSSHRPYRAARGVEVALDEVLAQRGTLYDAQIADACARIFREDGYEFPAQAG